MFVVSAIFWLVTGVALIALFLVNFFSKMNHNKKWSEYDDCGIF